MLDKARTIVAPVQGRQRRVQFGKVTTIAEDRMAWTTPQITEICIGMEVTSYLSAEV
jgi:coenzyme PQQ precursor peptide PqqA